VSHRHRVKAVLVSFLVLVFLLTVFPISIFIARSWRGRFQGFVARIAAFFWSSLLVTIGCGLAGGVPLAAIPFGVTIACFAMILVCIPLIILFRRPPLVGAGPVDSHFLQKWNPNLFGWDDVEDEYVWLVVQCVTRLDPWMPGDERVQVRDTIRRLLDEIGTLPDYYRLARVTSLMGIVLRNGRLDPHHCYSYRPAPQESGERFGLFVFLHGHGTNCLVLLHALRSLADRMRLVLVAPTFGYGNWEAPGGVEAIDRARRFGLEAFEVNPSRVFLAGLSQGGAGVSRAAAATPDRYAGLVFISATMELSVIDSEAFATGWKGKPVLVIQGQRDRNVTPQSVVAGVETMEAHKVRVTMQFHPESGHFLFFAKLSEMERQIADWIGQIPT